MSLNIEQLVKEGEALETQIDGMTLSGKEYSEWITICSFYLEENHKSAAFTKQFIEKSKNAVGSWASVYYELLGIMSGVQKLK